MADAEAFSAYLADQRPRAIVHAAAMKSLVDCERSKAATLQVNLLPAEVVRDYAARHKAKVVFVSSDIVFDGKSGDFQPIFLRRLGSHRSARVVACRVFDRLRKTSSEQILADVRTRYNSP